MPWPIELEHWAPEGLGDAAGAYWAGFAAGVQPDPDLTVSQWADQFRVLSSVSSAERGQWHTDRTPYLREIMDCCTPSHPMTDGAFQKGTQLGGSEAVYNFLGYVIDQAPGPAMLVMPTVDGAKTISRQRIKPLIEESPALRGKVAEAKSRDSGNTTLQKEFTGGVLKIVGANSGPGLRNMPVRYLIGDEVDAYPADVDGEGDPIVLAEKRTDTFGSRAKRIYVSSPKLAGSSRIDPLRREGSNARYYVPCPHCAHEQFLRWTQMRWAMYERREMTCSDCGAVSEIAHDAVGEAMCHHCDAWSVIGDSNTRQAATDVVARAWYECEACGGEIGEEHKPNMLARGRWIHANLGPGQVLEDNDPHPWALWAWVGKTVRRYLPTYARPLSWHLPSLYSPLGWFSWSKAVAQYLKAKAGGVDEVTGEPLMQVFTNTVLAEVYEAPGERPNDNKLRSRAEPYRIGQVPRECLLLVGSVDVQGNRIEALCLGFGRDGRKWVIDHQRFYGDTTDLGDKGPWAALTAWRRTAFPHASGAKVRMNTVAVDSGHYAQTVYYYCAMYRGEQVFAVKGNGERGRPILGLPKWTDIDHRGQKIKDGCQLWSVGTDTAKEQIYRALEMSEPGYGWIAFPQGLSDEFYQQLTAEKFDAQARTKRFDAGGRRNEILDLVVYGFAAAERAGVRRADWDLIESRVNPAMRDLFAPEPETVVNETTSESEAVPPPTDPGPQAATEGGPDATASVPTSVRKPVPVAPKRRAAKPAPRASRRPILTW